MENAQVSVYLVHAADHRHEMINCKPYLPRCWTEDPNRLDEVGVQGGIGFATKHALATGMLTRTLQAAIPARWVASDEVYGANPT